jgi:predicted dehydrogenase
MPDVDLVALVDTNESRLNEVCQALDQRGAKSHLELTGEIDAAVVATPAKTHYQVARELLERRIHTFVEKPLTTRLPEADHLVNLAEDRGVILQAGHIERFNPAWENAKLQINEPKYIEARRSGRFTFRAVDIGVVLDLMIHDIDLALQLADSEVVDVEAFGISVLGRHEDLAHARLRFASGCIADFSASRLSPTASRSMNVFCPNIYARVDFHKHETELIRPPTEIGERRLNLATLTDQQKKCIEERLFESVLQRSQMTVGTCDALADEIRDFIKCVRNSEKPRVPGADGRNAIAVAETVLEQIAMHRWSDNVAGPAGPLAIPMPEVFRPRIWPEPSEFPARKAG